MYDDRLISVLERIACALEEQNLHLQSELTPTLRSLAQDAHRLADGLAPDPSAIVDTRYVANRTGHTTQWVREQITGGKIPSGCIAQHAGNGTYWKFHRERIDLWIEKR